MTQITPATTNRPRGRPPKDDLRGHLLRHTLKVLLRDGYQRFSMNAVAVSARSSKETLYRHFGDKHGLLGAALGFIGEGVQALLLEGVGNDLARDARLYRLGSNYLRGLLLGESLTLQRIAYADGQQGLGPVFAKQFTDVVLAVMTQQCEDMATPAPALDAEVFLAMVQGQVHEKALLGLSDAATEAACHRVVEHAVRVFAAYLEASVAPDGSC